MRRGIPLVLVGVVVVVLLCAPARAGWIAAFPKWDQLSEGFDPYGGASWIDGDFGEAITADDFVCTSRFPIVGIHFNGFDMHQMDPPEQFRVRFWSDVPATSDDESHPGEVLYDRLIDPANSADPLKIGWQEVVDDSFRINLAEEDWFRQEGSAENPVIYWISIQGVMPVDGDFDSFFWRFRHRLLPTAGGDAAFASDHFGYDPWWNWAWSPEAKDLPIMSPDLYDGPFDPTVYWKSGNMAFELTALPEPTTLGLLALGGLGLLARRRRTA